MNNRDIFNKFKEISKNSLEAFDDTPQNVRRWQHHILQHEKTSALIKSRPDVFGVELSEKYESIVDGRRVDSFEQLPDYAKTVCLHVASFFPATQVYIFGSRIDGTYIDQYDNDTIRDIRRLLRKKTVAVSDYDITTDQYYPNVKERLPKNIDYVQFVPTRKIKIPMWNYDALPEWENETALQAYLAADIGKLIRLHNVHKLSGNNYCCGVEKNAIMEHFRHLLTIRGIIQA